MFGHGCVMILVKVFLRSCVKSARLTKINADKLSFKGNRVLCCCLLAWLSCTSTCLDISSFQGTTTWLSTRSSLCNSYQILLLFFMSCSSLSNCCNHIWSIAGIWNSVGMLFEVSNDVRTTSERHIERRQRASKPRPQSIILSVSFHYPFSFPSIILSVFFHFLSFVFSHFFRIDSKHKKHHEPEHHVVMNAW